MAEKVGRPAYDVRPSDEMQREMMWERLRRQRKAFDQAERTPFSSLYCPAKSRDTSIVSSYDTRRKWYILEFEDGHVEVWSSPAGRVRRVAELTVNERFSEVKAHRILEM